MLPANLVEDHLFRAEWSWRISRGLERSAMIGIVVLGLLLLLGFLAIVGLVSSMGLAVLTITIVLLLSGLVWTITALVTMTAPLDRTRLGSELERAEPRLMDRVNTLVHLEGRLDKNSPLLTHIAAQSAEVLDAPGSGRPHVPGRVARVLGLLAGLALLTGAFYGYFRPLDRIRAAELAAEQRQQQEEAERLVIPDETWLEEPPAVPMEEPWSEIRIRDPGQDLRATRFDLIPLVIEAYSTEPIQEISLTIHVRGREPVTVPFPPSDDPHYALHEYELDLLAHDVVEWDVISYFAESRTKDPRKTDLYFIDVLPTREELGELPGGQEGEPYQTLQQLTQLLQRQQEILRDHHRNSNVTDDSQQRSMELAPKNDASERQTELADNIREFADRLSPRWDERLEEESSEENKGPEEGNEVEKNEEEANTKEENGKDKNKVEENKVEENKVEENNESGDENGQESVQDNEQENSRENIRGSAQESGQGNAPESAPENGQESLEESAPARDKSLPSQLRQIAEWLALTPETAQPSQSESLQEHVGEGLCQLACARRDAARHARDHADRFQPSGMPGSGAAEAGSDVRAGDRDEGGDELNEGGEDEVDGGEVDKGEGGEEEGDGGEGDEGEGDGGEGGEGEGGKGEGGEGEGGEEEQGDGAGPQGRNSESLLGQGQEAWNRAARQLESLQRRQASGQPLDPQQAQRLRDDTAAQLAHAIESMLGSNDSGDQPLTQLRRELEQPRDTLDWNQIRELMGQVQQKRREAISRSVFDAEAAELRNIEPTRLPPAYRGAIERYFQNLSESP